MLDKSGCVHIPPLYEEGTAKIFWESVDGADGYELDMHFDEDFEAASHGLAWSDVDISNADWETLQNADMTWEAFQNLPAQGRSWRSWEFENASWQEFEENKMTERQWFFARFLRENRDALYTESKYKQLYAALEERLREFED